MRGILRLILIIVCLLALGGLMWLVPFSGLRDGPASEIGIPEKPRESTGPPARVEQGGSDIRVIDGQDPTVSSSDETLDLSSGSTTAH